MRECEALRGRFLAVVVACVMAVGERTSVADLRESAERAGARDARRQCRHRCARVLNFWWRRHNQEVLNAAPLFFVWTRVRCL